MKQFKLKKHQQNYSEEPLLFNTSDLPNVKPHDLLKIYHCDGLSSNFLLFLVKTLKDCLPKDTISIEASVANGWKVFHDVHVEQVEAEDVTIDLIEVTFKDHYISRSDMWRMKKHLVNSCAYIDKYVEYSDIRAQVNEIWANSLRVQSGFISDSTNIVFRSFTAKVYVFIQMSSEMWEYDAYGYLQFERAVDGFLKALFRKWKKKKCCHELTLVLFSRIFYDVRGKEEFPISIRNEVKQNYYGKYYLDFYKCVVQMERMDDCTTLLPELKRLFHGYKELTHIAGCPFGNCSSSAEGNFLEAVNMSLNVFERHNVDRSFDRTGQIVVCVTPGVGVFDVDRDLARLTKERMIDNGIGSDLICLGQQPLHAVPLFKFHQNIYNRTNNKKSFEFVRNIGMKTHLLENDFNIPQWINHSFYTSNPFPDKGTTNINYITSIHVPPIKMEKLGSHVSSLFTSKTSEVNTDELPFVQQLSYTEYDKQIFAYQKPCAVGRKIGKDSIKASKFSILDSFKKRKSKLHDEIWVNSPEKEQLIYGHTRPVHIPVSNAYRYIREQEGMASSLGATTNAERQGCYNQDGNGEIHLVIGSATVSHTKHAKRGNPTITHRRALFNPFNLPQICTPLTANRRRWVHTYPCGPQGEASATQLQNQLHFQRGVNQHPPVMRNPDEEEEHDGDASVLNVLNASFLPLSNNHTGSLNKARFDADESMHLNFDENNSISNMSVQSLQSVTSVTSNRSLLMESNLEYQEPISKESFATCEGLDWKSLKCPACLPITTDYSPSQTELQSKCVEQTYDLVPDEVTYEVDKTLLGENITTKFDLNERYIRTPREIFLELINQRLCLGFQIIKKVRRRRNADSSSSCATLTSPNASEGSFRSMGMDTSPMYLSSSNSFNGNTSPNIYMLSHGRQYHVVCLSSEEDKIEVKIYKPRHSSTTITLQYSYMLWPKGHSKFQLAKSLFAHEKMEDYYWNHLDEYVCDPDDNEFQLGSNLRCWQTKFILIAAPIKRMHLLKTAKDNNTGENRYDVFYGCSCKISHDNLVELGECGAMIEGFVRFLEHLNKFKRPPQHSRKSWKSLTNLQSNLYKSYSSSTTTGHHRSNHTTPTPPPNRPASSTPTSSERSTPVRSLFSDTPMNEKPPLISANLMHGVDVKPVPVKGTKDFLQQSDVNISQYNSDHALTVNSEFAEIISALKHPQSGLNFIPEQYGLPKYSFITLEAVHWSLANIGEVNSIKDACMLLDTMRKLKFFVHLSGDVSVSFVYGYILFSISEENESFEIDDPTSYQYQPVTFGELPKSQNQWFEVEIKRYGVETANNADCLLSSKSNSFQERLRAFYVTPQSEPSPGVLPRKQNSVKIPLLNKMRSNRTEWCQIKYSPNTYVGTDKLLVSFEIQWIVATAASILKMLQMWFREATRCDLYFFPVPSNPFAFPRGDVSSPLRSPHFIPLNLQAVTNILPQFHGQNLCDDGIPEKLESIMKAILYRFGFICDDNRSSNEGINYVHFTGQALVQISKKDVLSKVSPNRIIKPESIDVGDNLKSGVSSTLEETLVAGFYWNANYMLTKIWRLTSIVEECPLLELENDFVKFCANVDFRLTRFIEEM